MKDNMSTTYTAAAHNNRFNKDDLVYQNYLHALNVRLASVLQNGGMQLYTTNIDPEEIWSTYLNSFPLNDRQAHNCNACRHFIQRFGGLVVIDDRGETMTAFWNESDAPEHYRLSVINMRQLVDRATVSGVFYAGKATLGEPQTGHYLHLHGSLPASMVHRDRLTTPAQASALKLEERGMLLRGLNEYSEKTIDVALQVLRAESVYQSERFLSLAEWLKDLYRARSVLGRAQFRNFVWKAVATAPVGWCHVRSSMIGTLLDDIQAGKDFAAVKAAFDAKMHPLRYQRPQAAPTAGNILAGEAVIAKMGLARSLLRRFALADEVVALWAEKAVAAPDSASASVFAHLKPKGAEPATRLIVAGAITFEKFRRVVLPTVESIKIYAPREQGSYGAFVTAVDPAGPPILQWDCGDGRNRFSWYTYVNGSSAARWGLFGSSWHDVPVISLKPWLWLGQHGADHGVGALFVIAGARDEQHVGAALFPSTLRSELHPIRATIEAYSKTANLERPPGQHAAGLFVGSSSASQVRVKVGNAITEYTIDRWD